MRNLRTLTSIVIVMTALLSVACVCEAQVPPSAVEKSQYKGILAAAAAGNVAQTKAALVKGEKTSVRDGYGRTPLHVAVHGRHRKVVKAIVEAGADLNALERDRYDAVTIAAVADDVETLRLLLELGASAKNITSRYDGTALIAAAHLGHEKVVELLIRSGAPLNHVNNLGWTALIEAIVLGNGGARHTETVRLLVHAGADVNLADRDGVTPLRHARNHGYREMAEILKKAGARE